VPAIIAVVVRKQLKNVTAMHAGAAPQKKEKKQVSIMCTVAGKNIPMLVAIVA
jgi:hypothetical protein